MANSDWARETPQKEEIKWFYFQPVLGQIIEEGWEFRLPGEWKWLRAVSSIGDTIKPFDIHAFWRKPYTSKGN